MGDLRLLDPRLDNMLLLSDKRRSIGGKGRLLHRTLSLLRAICIVRSR